MSRIQFIPSLFANALLKMFFYGLPMNEEVFVETVLAGLGILIESITANEVQGFKIIGLSRVTLPDNALVRLPWGILRPAPKVNFSVTPMMISQPETNCLFLKECRIPIRFTSSQDRSVRPLSADTNPLDQKAELLLPLVFALASPEDSSPTAAVKLWSRSLYPFNNVWTLMPTLGIPGAVPTVDFGARIAELESWAQIIDERHTDKLDISAKRIVSAIGHRHDASDSLLDAMMVWENLFGSSSETTFRVTASLAKLLESDSSNRKTLRAELSKIYGVRSKIVHGQSFNPANVREHRERAIDIAVRALRKSYQRGAQWLNSPSEERSSQILLE